MRQTAENFKTLRESGRSRYVAMVFEDPQRKRLILLVVIAIVGILIGLLDVKLRRD